MKEWIKFGENIMQVKIPPKIKIGTHTYTIEFDPHLHTDEKAFGQINYRTQKIRIWAEAPQSIKDQSFLHEVIHLAEHIYRVTITDEDIDRIAQCICDLLINNLEIEFDWSEIK